MAGIQVRWFDPGKTILHWEYGEFFTWENCDKATADSCELIDEVDHIVDALMDYSSNRVIPGDAASRIPEMLLNHPLLEHPRAGLAVYVGGGAQVDFLVNLIRRFQRTQAQRFIRASNIAEALDLLAAKRLERAGKRPESPGRVVPPDGN